MQNNGIYEFGYQDVNYDWHNKIYYVIECIVFPDFCRISDSDEVQPFWYAVQDKAVENYTMKEVFDMESTVRVEAIENLGLYGF